MGFEPTTNGLEDRDSTSELIPQIGAIDGIRTHDHSRDRGVFWPTELLPHYIGAIDGTRTRDLSRDKGISYQLNDNRIVFLERQEGIEPSPKHWQCFILPLKYWRILCFGGQCWNRTNHHIFVRDTLYQWVNCPFWRDRWDSNPRPFPWQGSILTNWTTTALYLGAIDRIRTCDLSPKWEYLNHLNYYCI